MELIRTIYYKMCIIQKTPEDQKVMRGTLESLQRPVLQMFDFGAE
jgi:hypothetical protein